VTHYDDLGLYRLIARVSDVAELERFCAERLGGLLEYDAHHGSELLATLRAVIEADGNLQKAAEILCVHYNTLRYRIQRIQEIQGCRVDSWRQMAEVDAALKAYQVLKVWKASARNSAPVPLVGG
jgi:purine catabolism regulator